VRLDGSGLPACGVPKKMMPAVNRKMFCRWVTSALLLDRQSISFTTMPPRLCAMKMIGFPDDTVGRSAPKAARKSLPMSKTQFPSSRLNHGRWVVRYPYVRILAFGTVRGRRSRGQKTWLSVAIEPWHQVESGFPFKPWTKITLAPLAYVVSIWAVTYVSSGLLGTTRAVSPSKGTGP